MEESSAGMDDQPVYRTLADIARERIIRDIVELRLHPGEIVQLNDLASEYGMSRTPVREALARMQQTGLITSIPYKGYRVRPLDKRDIEDVIFMRALLEPKSAECAALRISDDELAELATIRPPQVDKFDLEFDRYSERFHTFIGHASGSRRLGDMIALVYRDLARLQYAGLSRTVPSDVVAAHETILAALQAHDAAAASAAMKEHVLVVHAKALEQALAGEEMLGYADLREATDSQQ
jgi:DNA-binding GntR family transcriptional regulator